MANGNKRQRSHRKRVVIIGGGFAGQALVQELRNAPVDVVLIDKNNFLTFQPLLYEVATAGLEPEEITYPLRGIIHNAKNVRFRLGEVTNIDWQKKRVLLKDQSCISFDYLVMAAGATPNYFNIEGAECNSFPLKSLSNAIGLRSHILNLFERADQNPELIKSGILNFVIVGGGPTGVEMAGALIELFQNVLKRDYPHLPLDKARVVLIEASTSLLRMFKEESREHALDKLRERGVHVACDERVIRITKESVYLQSKRRIPTSTTIWAVGVKASPLADIMQLEQTRGGRLVVNQDLSVPGRNGVFAIGDISAAKDDQEQLLPQLASVAQQQGKHVANQIVRHLNGKEMQPFAFKNPGKMATIGRHAAVAEFPGDIRVAGVVAWLTWLGLHLALLVGFHNRLHVLISWVCNYITKNRSARLILESMDKETQFESSPPQPRLPEIPQPVIQNRKIGQHVPKIEQPLSRIHSLLYQTEKLKKTAV